VERCDCFSGSIILIRISFSIASIKTMKFSEETLENQTNFSLKLEGVYGFEGLDPAYQAKASILNEAIQEIGMGRYQWYASKSLSPRSYLIYNKGTFRGYRLWLACVSRPLLQ